LAGAFFCGFFSDVRFTTLLITREPALLVGVSQPGVPAKHNPQPPSAGLVLFFLDNSNGTMIRTITAINYSNKEASWQR